IERRTAAPAVVRVRSDFGAQREHVALNESRYRNLDRNRRLQFHHAEGARARARRYCAERVERRRAVDYGEAHDAGLTVEFVIVPQASNDVGGCEVDRAAEKV